MTGKNKDGDNVVKLVPKKQGSRPDYSLSPTEKKAKKPAVAPIVDKSPRDPIMSYLGKLPRKRPDRGALISWNEYNKIIAAIEPLRSLLPFVDADTVLEIIDEYDGDPKPTVRAVAKMEESLWLNVEIAEEELIPHFNFKAAHVHFKVAPEQRKNRVLFLKNEFKRPIEPPSVPLQLVKGEMYFFIVLRMYRKQYEKDFAGTEKSLTFDRLP
jgi:hypothetical protein